MPRNARIIILLQPLWAIPFNLVNSYASLYMLDQGISSSQVGLVNSVSFVFKTAVALMAGYIINKFGRKRTMGLIDIFGWALPMLVYFLAEDFWQFLAAALINSITVINSVTYQCFLTEDVDSDKRIETFKTFSVVSAVCGLFVPITGILIGRYTLVPTVRWLYFIAFFSMASFGIFRLILLKETSIGRQMIDQHTSGTYPLKSLIKLLIYFLQNKKLIILFAMYIVLNFTQVINSLFFMPYLTRFGHFTEAVVSLFPFMTTIVSMIVFFLVIHRIRNKVRSILCSIASFTAGTFILIVSPFIINYLALLSVVFWALAFAIINPVLNTLIANEIADEFRVDVLGFFNMLSMLCMFPVGYLGGMLFDISPLYLMVTVFIFGLASFCLLAFFYKRLHFSDNE